MEEDFRVWLLVPSKTEVCFVDLRVLVLVEWNVKRAVDAVVWEEDTPGVCWDDEATGTFGWLVPPYEEIGIYKYIYALPEYSTLLFINN